MARFLEVLLATPAGGLSPLCRYIVANGGLYMVMGAGMMVAPKSLLDLAFMAQLTGQEPGYAHVIGMTTLIIGWFYVMGGRTGTDSFALATVVDRLLVVPVVLLPLGLSGAVPLMAALPFAVLDPVLAIGALAIWRRSDP